MTINNDQPIHGATPPRNGCTRFFLPLPLNRAISPVNLPSPDDPPSLDTSSLCKSHHMKKASKLISPLPLQKHPPQVSTPRGGYLSQSQAMARLAYTAKYAYMHAGHVGRQHAPRATHLGHRERERSAVQRALFPPQPYDEPTDLRRVQRAVAVGVDRCERLLGGLSTWKATVGQSSAHCTISPCSMGHTTTIYSNICIILASNPSVGSPFSGFLVRGKRRRGAG
jgi:hypothetical protein